MTPLRVKTLCQDSKSTANETEVATPNPVTPDSTCAQVVTENISKTKDTVNATQLTSPVNAADHRVAINHYPQAYQNQISVSPA